MKHGSIPLPVSHESAPVRCPRVTAVLALATAFVGGVCVAVWFVVLLTPAP